jgi:hypothetical protein
MVGCINHVADLRRCLGPEQGRKNVVTYVRFMYGKRGMANFASREKTPRFVSIQLLDAVR